MSMKNDNVQQGILQNYVDEVFRSILDTDAIPPAVKHFFDYLDELAKSHSIEDEEILHLWKTNRCRAIFAVLSWLRLVIY